MKYIVELKRIFMPAGWIFSAVFCAAAQVPVRAEAAETGAGQTALKELVNLDHLNWLTRMKDGLGAVSVYAERDTGTGEYSHVFAKGAGNKGKELEGVACVDDVARAAALVLKYFRLTGDEAVLPRARAYLEFVLYMQASDGTFYNFTYADQSINRKGKTSRKGFDWWTARAMWALGSAYGVFRERDPDFARRIRDSLERARPALKPWLKQSGKYLKISDESGQKRKVPRWLLNDSGGMTAVAVIGLTHYYEAAPDEELKAEILRLCRALADFQYGDFQHAPYGAHMAWAQKPGTWHGWGSRQSQALAYAGRVLKRSDLIGSAKKEADMWLSRLIVTGIPYMVSMGKGESRFLEQIPYAQSCAVMGMHEIGLATGDDRYHAYAGLLASWFFGNNVTGKPMYDPGTGRGYDGISDRKGAIVRNLNSGGEATVEALMAVLDASSHPESRRTMQMTRHHRPQVVPVAGEKYEMKIGELPLPGQDVLQEMRVFEDPDTGGRLRIVRDFKDESVRLEELP
ncbi:MAG: hypothetical protein KKH28_09875 [Elusimicrobia bacterium]|nr:hypothetical protein [Elusimicrobiota bacterium]